MRYVLALFESNKDYRAILFQVVANETNAFKPGLRLHAKLGPDQKYYVDTIQAIIFDFFPTITKSWFIVNKSQLSLAPFSKAGNVGGILSNSPYRSVTLKSHNHDAMRRLIKDHFIKDITHRLPKGDYRIIFYHDGKGLVNEKIIIKFLSEGVADELTYKVT